MLPPEKEFAGNWRNKGLQLLRRIVEKHLERAPLPKGVVVVPFAGRR